MSSSIIVIMKGLKRFELLGSVVRLHSKKFGKTLVLEVTLAGQGERVWYHTVRYLGSFAEQLVDLLDEGDPFLALGEITLYERKDGNNLLQLNGEHGLLVDKAVSYDYDKNGSPRMREGKNRCSLIGRLTATPERRQMGSGNLLTAFRVAVKDSKDKTCFIETRAFSQDLVRKTEALGRGIPVWITGSLYSTSWLSQSGEKRYGLEVHADDLEVLFAFNQQNVGAKEMVGA